MQEVKKHKRSSTIQVEAGGGGGWVGGGRGAPVAIQHSSFLVEQSAWFSCKEAALRSSSLQKFTAS